MDAWKLAPACFGAAKEGHLQEKSLVNGLPAFGPPWGAQRVGAASWTSLLKGPRAGGIKKIDHAPETIVNYGARGADCTTESKGFANRRVGTNSTIWKWAFRMEGIAKTVQIVELRHYY